MRTRNTPALDALTTKVAQINGQLNRLSAIDNDLSAFELASVELESLLGAGMDLIPLAVCEHERNITGAQQP